MQKSLGRNTVVLLGVGHTNAHVLRMWKMDPPKNAQLVCVSDFPVVTYSGMLPGVIAGQYPKSAMEIDLIRLTQSVGARVVVDEVTGMDHGKRQLLFKSRPLLSFDVLAIGIGSRPSFNDVDVSADAPMLAIKPMQTFLRRLGEHLTEIYQSTSTPRIVIVGGGVGSIEIAFCLHERFSGKPRNGVDGWPEPMSPEISIATGSARIGGGLPDSTTAHVQRELNQRSISVQTGARVTSVDNDGLTLKSGQKIPADLVIWATGAVAGPLLGKLGLETDQSGFLLTNQNLEVTKLQGVFAVGDSGSIIGSTISKAGVYAVRQGPVLVENIQRSLTDSKPLQEYHPQKEFLKIINLGNDRAIAEYRGFSFANRLCWKMKDYIDVKFMRMYQDYEPMEMAADPVEDNAAMRCLGCGGKIGSQILSGVLSELQVVKSPDVKIGLANPDDAAIVVAHNNEVTVTTDFFAAPFDDPYLVGRIASLNSASDCFVMGAKPTSALAIVQIPVGHARAQAQVMREIMTGSVEEFNAMGAAIVGGHSIEGPRMLVGFTVLGKQIVDPTTKGMLQPGDQLILSKSIGTGVLLAAWMQCQMPAKFYMPLIESMLQSNEIALELATKFPVTALTDVTGFGLIGHLSELMVASRVSVNLNKKNVPVLPGCQQLIDGGIQSTLAPDNRSLAGRINIKGCDVEANELAALFDPQTGGGLLFGIGTDHVDTALSFLSDSGFDRCALIGEVVAKTESPELVIS